MEASIHAFPVLHDRYRIRLPTEKELEMKVSKDVKKMRNYESTLLFAYKVLFVNPNFLMLFS